MAKAGLPIIFRNSEGPGARAFGLTRTQRVACERYRSQGMDSSSNNSGKVDFNDSFQVGANL